MKISKNLNLFKVNTTAYEEEDFILLTTLTEEQVIEVISPIVNDERENNVVYDNDILVEALTKAYPKAILLQYTMDGIDVISI